MGPLDDITFGGGGLDRAAEIRGDSRAVAALVAQPGTRVLPLWRGRVLLEEERLTGLPPDHALFDGAPEAAVLLGRDSAGAAILARPIAMGFAVITILTIVLLGRQRIRDNREIAGILGAGKGVS